MSDIDSMNISSTSTLGSFTEEEIKIAQKKAAACRIACKKVGVSLFNSIEKLYDFEQGGHYLALKFKNVREWMESEGLVASTFFKYLAIYKSFTINNAIMLDTYRELDLSKILTLKALADNGAERDELIEAIEEADELVIGDLHDITNDKVKRLKVGKGVTEEEGEVKDPLEKLESGAYKIVPLTKQDHKIDPRFNKKDMVLVKGVSSKWWWNVDTEEFITVIK
jgi:hypothetical protein